MDGAQSEHRPGDTILNRYMPDASQEEREAARENLRKLARFVLRVADRMAREEREQQSRAPEEGGVKSGSQFTTPK